MKTGDRIKINRSRTGGQRLIEVEVTKVKSNRIIFGHQIVQTATGETRKRERAFIL